jgi:tagatose-6-phosphate ketose/aldose isomerase
MSDLASAQAADSTAVLTGTATYREIAQQPEVWREVVRIVHKQRTELDDFLNHLLSRDDLRIVFTGAGTSAFIGEILVPALRARLARRIEAIATTDLVSDPAAHFAEDVPTLLVSFARSGDSPESGAATDLADRLLTEVGHLILTCNPDGGLCRAHRDRPDSLVLLMPARSDDEGFAMTSSFTAMLLSALLVFPGGNDAAVEPLAAAAGDVIRSIGRIESLVAGGPRRVVYLGSGPLTGLARESALKLVELTAGRVAAFHDSALGFRHGPKALLDEETLAVVFVSSDPYRRLYDEDIVAELRATMGADRVLAVSTQPLRSRAASDWVLSSLIGLEDAYLAPAYAVFAQLFAVYYAVRLGGTPDNPFPDGDVNRVVKGVRIHPLPEGSDRKAAR